MSKKLHKTARVPRKKRVVEYGSWGSVEYAIRTNGDMEAKDWLESQSQGTQASFLHLFRKHANGHVIHNQQQFRQLTDNIYEYKRKGDRILAFEHQRTWFLTNRHKKNGPSKCPKKIINRAETIRIECLEILKEESAGKKK